jgi:hypothetical protein
MKDDDMARNPLSNIDSWIAVLAVLSKLSNRGQPTIECTTDSIQRDLKKIYCKDLTKREIEYILQGLQDRGFVFSEKGLLRDGRQVLYGIHPGKITKEAFTLIKIDPDRAYAHDGYEGLVYDPPRANETNPFQDDWASKLSTGIAKSIFGRDGSLELLEAAGAFLKSPECDALVKGITNLF